jgi:MFS family permease
VIALGVVSLLNDLSSEMIYPLLPLFLTGVLGASAVALGAVEGVAEAGASLLKVVAGGLSDRGRRRKPWVVVGYVVAGAARGLIGLAGGWGQVLGLRLADRAGKGVRTAPRDALIADATPTDRRGAAFGYHRAMDHAGAVLGPLVAAGLLAIGVGMRSIFLLAAVPAAATVAVVLAAVRERPAAEADRAALPLVPVVTRPGWRAWTDFGAPYRQLLVALAVFTLGNSTDAFLLLRLHDAGLATGWVAVLWSAHHVLKMTTAWLGGAWSDRRGRRAPLLAGWAVYAAVYLGFAATTSLPALVGLFLLYGLYFGLTEPVEKAWVVDLAPAARRGAALGLYHGTVGLAALPASLLFGLLWSRFGAPTAFLTGAALAALAALLLLRLPTRPALAVAS